MKRILPAALAATVAVAAAAHGQSAPTTLHLVDHYKAVAFLDAKPKSIPKKETLADTVTVSGTLTGDSTGASHLICTTVVPGGKAHEDFCQGDAKLQGGDLFFTGRLADSSKTGSLAITGGTGQYAGATGSITSTDGKHNTTLITVTLGS